MSINLDKSSTSQVEGQIATPYSIPRVNLMPPEVFERRAVRKVQLGVGAAALACVAVAAGGYFLSARDADKAQDDLNAEQATAAQLTTEQAKYAEVPKTLALVQQAEAARDAAMSTDIQWATVVGQIAATHPSDAWLKTVAITTAGGTNSTSSTTTTATSGTPSVATLTFAGSAKNYRGVAAWLASMEKVPNMVNPKMQSATLVKRNDRTVVDFATTSGLSAGAYSHKTEGSGN